MRIVKFLLYIDRDEQAKRFHERIDDQTKNWKFSLEDLKEREHWDEYIQAYEAMLHDCSTDYAPWYVIPANRKWFRNYAVAQIVKGRTGGHGSQVPQESTADLSGIKFE